MSGTLYVPLKADYFEDPKIIHAGEAAELLFVHILAYCSRTFTDGFIDDAQMTRLGLKRVEKRAATLAQLALITRVDDSNSHGYRVTSWLKHNKSVKATAKARERESMKGKEGNHLRWHVQQRIVVADCEWCESCDSKPKDDRDPDRVPDESESGDPKGPDSIETETPSASATSTAADPTSADSSQEDDPRLSVVVGLLARRATERATQVGDRARYEKGALKKITEERGEAIRHLLEIRPSATADTIVDLLEHSAAPTTRRRDPNANRKAIERVVSELAEGGLFGEEELVDGSAFVPLELAAPLPPDLAARARRQEDECEQVAS